MSLIRYDFFLRVVSKMQASKSSGIRVAWGVGLLHRSCLGRYSRDGASRHLRLDEVVSQTMIKDLTFAVKRELGNGQPKSVR